jgi:hypothetical protein
MQYPSIGTLGFLAVYFSSELDGFVRAFESRNAFLANGLKETDHALALNAY